MRRLLWFSERYVEWAYLGGFVRHVQRRNAQAMNERGVVAAAAQISDPRSCYTVTVF